MGYKVWLDLVELPPHVWSLDELAVISASFGLILVYAPLNNVRSFERSRLIIATDNLAHVPRSIELFLNGRIIIIPTVVVGWAQETTAFQTITDTTPSDDVYQNMAQDIFAKLELENMKCSPSSSPSGFVWPNLSERNNAIIPICQPRPQ
jgi:hypothetical protein